MIVATSFSSLGPTTSVHAQDGRILRLNDKLVKNRAAQLTSFGKLKTIACVCVAGREERPNDNRCYRTVCSADVCRGQKGATDNNRAHLTPSEFTVIVGYGGGMSPKAVNYHFEDKVYHDDERDHASSESEDETVHSTYRTSVLSSRASLLPTSRWTSNSDGVEFFCSVVAMVYFIFMTIFGFNISLFAYDERVPVLNFVFSLVMYGAGIIFFVYMYFFVLYTGWMRFFRKAPPPEPDRRVAVYETTVAAPLYLRLGTLVFGTVAIIFYFLEMVLFFTNNYIHTREFIVHILATIFTFQQMCFICIHPKIRFSHSKFFIIFGMMHTVTVNLWTWFIFIFKKQTKKYKTMGANTSPIHLASSSSSSSSEEFLDTLQNTELHRVFPDNFTSQIINNAASLVLNEPDIVTSYIFADFLAFMHTCVVELAIIAAAVMFVLWKTIHRKEYRVEDLQEQKQKKKHKGRCKLDCSESAFGIIACIVFIIAIGVMIGIYHMLKVRDVIGYPAVILEYTDLGLFVVLIVATVIAAIRMRKLEFDSHDHGPADLLDRLLLFMAFCAELAYSGMIIVVWISLLHTREDKLIHVPFVYGIRLVQVITQTAFIFQSLRLKDNHKTKHGKQFVTFIFLANTVLFFFTIYESIENGIGFLDAPDGSGQPSYAFVVHFVSPLIVFYRFHSSACLAELWEHIYGHVGHH
uniref:XK-related protein n=1 Tax=Steinernema glaseri TaxID=37863 RepID=A0A1I7ZIG8_9BILA